MKSSSGEKNILAPRAEVPKLWGVSPLERAQRNVRGGMAGPRPTPSLGPWPWPGHGFHSQLWSQTYFLPRPLAVALFQPQLRPQPQPPCPCPHLPPQAVASLLVLSPSGGVRADRSKEGHDREKFGDHCPRVIQHFLLRPWLIFKRFWTLNRI